MRAGGAGAMGEGGAGVGEGMAPAAFPLLEVRDLTTRFHTRRGVVHAVNGISLGLHPGETLALVGESGSGKSVAALSLLGLVPEPGRVEGGEVRLRGSDLLGLDPEGWRRIRGREMAMVFQDPMTSLNPVLPVGRQIEEVLEHHLEMTRREARGEAARLLDRVGIPDAGGRLSNHPHQFSGGQRQRIMIAMALACRPAVLIADEPTTALDVTVQAQIVDLVRELQDELGMAVLWITHDLTLVAGLADRVAVMYAGAIVEEAPVAELFLNPRHPYTRGLMAAMPAMDTPGDTALGTKVDAPGIRRLTTIPGRPPVLLTPPAHCSFAPRCPRASELCWADVPPLQGVTNRDGTDGTGHRSACWHWHDLP